MICTLLTVLTNHIYVVYIIDPSTFRCLQHGAITITLFTSFHIVDGGKYNGTCQHYSVFSYMISFRDSCRIRLIIHIILTHVL